MPGDTLSISHLGYAKKQLIVSQTNIELLIKLSPQAIQLDQINIFPSLSSLNELEKVNLALNPVKSSQELLQKVPGLFIAQHAGGGKAEQIFLRGFDIDHGTDVQISADGIPVNMVSHAHGQGYADLHFLIPETLESIDFGKGPYYTNKGNFNTAGYVDFKTFDKLPSSQVKWEAGRFNTQRFVGLFNFLPKQTSSSSYLASEYIQTDGPFESPQHFNRFNLFGKYVKEFGNHKLRIQASTFNSRWDASGQIPVRAIDSGRITRFGAIDDTEGGNTSRHNLSLSLRSLVNDQQFIETQAFFSHYDFELYSNFTFFLNDPENGDQIRQKEKRNIYGVQSSLNRFFELSSFEGKLQVGAGFRLDDIQENELSSTLGRKQTLTPISLHNIHEFNSFLYTDLELRRNKWLLNTGLRLDQFTFSAVDLLADNYVNLSAKHAFLSPKLNLIYSPSNTWQFYFKSGRGFHSNDSRVAVTRQVNETLPAAYGWDVGSIFRPLPNLYIDLAAWYLYLEQEFVYVGDEGIVEPSGKSLRKGIDLGIRWQVHKGIFAHANLNLAQPRLLEAESREDHIPLAPTLTSSGGISALHPTGFSASLQYRYLADRPANEANSIQAEGYFLTDLSVNYDRPSWGIGLSVDNVLNREWREAQFETTSRLLDESAPVTEIHFTPGSPIFVKGSLVFRF